MDVNHPLSLLAGLTPAQFMSRHWQKKPLLVRQAISGIKPLLSRAGLFKLAASEEVESRLIVQNAAGWTMKNGPFASRVLPPLSRNAWTLLLQGVDLHDASAHQLLQLFRFVPDARLDDLMISFATPGGGVGPHFDSYDVFLLQASGRRRWRISRQNDLSLQSGVPLKILQNFLPEEEFLLEAGDMLYLPPMYAHDGVAELCEVNGKPQDCMTYSIGFRAPARRELAAELLHRLADFHEDDEPDAAHGEGVSLVPFKATDLYRDPDQPATSTPAAVPPALAEFAKKAVHDALKDPLALACALGEYMTEPKPSVWFDESAQPWGAEDCGSDIFLVAQTRMMYDAHHVFINGESHRAGGADAQLMQSLADQRCLGARQLGKASAEALSLLSDWHDAGWIRSTAAK